MLYTHNYYFSLICCVADAFLFPGKAFGRIWRGEVKVDKMTKWTKSWALGSDLLLIMASLVTSQAILDKQVFKPLFPHL